MTRGLWVAFVWGASCAVALQAAPATWEQVGQAKAEVARWRAARDLPAALAVCERFLRAHPDDGWLSNALASEAGRVLAELYPDVAARKVVYRRLVTDFADCPEYYCVAAGALAQLDTWPPPGQPRDLVEAERVQRGLLDKVGPRLQHDVAMWVYLNHLGVLHELARDNDAAVELPAALLACPGLLTNGTFLDTLCRLQTRSGDPLQAVRAARFVYVVCDYTATELKAAIERGATALSSTPDKADVLKLALSQDDPQTPNPLLAERYTLPLPADPDKLLAACGDSLDRRVPVLLAAGRPAEAFRTARRQVQSALGGDQKALARAMLNVARCFKAYDGNLVRANAWLAFHGAGTGADQWPALVGELGLTNEPLSGAGLDLARPLCQQAKLGTELAAALTPLAPAALGLPPARDDGGEPAAGLRALWRAKAGDVAPAVAQGLALLSRDCLARELRSNKLTGRAGTACAGLLALALLDHHGVDLTRFETIPDGCARPLARALARRGDARCVGLYEHLLEPYLRQRSDNWVDELLELAFYYTEAGEHARAAATFVRGPQVTTNREAITTYNVYAAEAYDDAGDRAHYQAMLDWAETEGMAWGRVFARGIRSRHAATPAARVAILAAPITLLGAEAAAAQVLLDCYLGAACADARDLVAARAAYQRAVTGFSHPEAQKRNVGLEWYVEGARRWLAAHP